LNLNQGREATGKEQLEVKGGRKCVAGKGGDATVGAAKVNKFKLQK
jgi:hypothetical protein